MYIMNCKAVRYTAFRYCTLASHNHIRKTVKQLPYLREETQLALYTQHIQAAQDSHLVENTNNQVEQGSLVVVCNWIVKDIPQLVEDNLVVLDIPAVAVESLAEEDTWDILGSLQAADIQDTCHTHVLQTTIHKMLFILYVTGEYTKLLHFMILTQYIYTP